MTKATRLQPVTTKLSSGEKRLLQAVATASGVSPSTALRAAALPTLRDHLHQLAQQSTTLAQSTDG
jgi:hypothetical protein